jgi:hypothetical protein
MQHLDGGLHDISSACAFNNMLPLCCVQSTEDPAANNTAIYCRQKLVVTVTVDSGDTISNQDVVFNLNCIGR